LLRCLLVDAQLLGELVHRDLGQQVVEICGHGVIASLRYRWKPVASSMPRSCPRPTDLPKIDWPPAQASSLGRHWLARWLCCASRAVSSVRAALVVPRLACTIHSRMLRRTERGKESQFSRACGRLSRASARSSGTTRLST